LIGKFRIIVGGFLAGYTSVSAQTHVLDTSNSLATWQRMDDYPFPIGLTHAATAVVGNKFYMCGGYAGGGIGMHTDVCMVYDHSKLPGKGLQWTRINSLPNGGRAGGGLVYDRSLNALIFSGGATRPIAQHRSALDWNNTWMYTIHNPLGGWVAKAPMPFFGNHMSAVTAKDADGIERHYFTGGQQQENEHDGNQADHYEFDALRNVWIKRKFMTIPRSHAASSARAYGCGFIVVAGCTNAGVRLADISYYDVPSDTWTKIGDLPSPINTPVCEISNGVLYCDTGWDSGKFSTKIKISKLPAVKPPTRAPVPLQRCTIPKVSLQCTVSKAEAVGHVS
jgi:N-acetylneuraminic acid mutarotase